jgi:2-oxoisovalerate dehydrogenase E2 component (dihydrolipoyl transacylase)
MAEVHQFRLPDVGEGLTEAEIVAWRVAVGDTVSTNDTLVEIETAKAVVELPSPFAGTVLGLLAEAGQTVEVGSPIIVIGDPAAVPDQVPGAGPPGAAVPGAASPDPAVPEERHEVLVGYGPTRTNVARRPRRTPPVPVPGRPGRPASSRPLASPPVRKLARILEVDLTSVEPTGTRGHVTRQDVQQASENRRPGPLAAADAPPAEIRTPIQGIRKRTAEAMVASAFTAPHVTEWLTVDVTRSMRLLKTLRDDPSYADVRLTPLLLVARAVLHALAAYPQANAAWRAGPSEIAQFRDVNLGIAAATPRGLVVPNIPAANRLTGRALAAALTELTATARAGKTTPERLRHGTFTITNFGVFGVDGATPILNPGEAGILGTGQIAERPWAHKGKVRLRSVMTLVLSFDHRLIDGELGSLLLAHIGRLLERPELGVLA